jgi:hypothetical protein
MQWDVLGHLFLGGILPSHLLSDPSLSGRHPIDHLYPRRLLPVTLTMSMTTFQEEIVGKDQSR